MSIDFNQLAQGLGVVAATIDNGMQTITLVKKEITFLSSVYRFISPYISTIPTLFSSAVTNQDTPLQEISHTRYTIARSLEKNCLNKFNAANEVALQAIYKLALISFTDLSQIVNGINKTIFLENIEASKKKNSLLERIEAREILSTDIDHFLTMTETYNAVKLKEKRKHALEVAEETNNEAIRAKMVFLESYKEFTQIKVRMNTIPEESSENRSDSSQGSYITPDESKYHLTPINQPQLAALTALRKKSDPAKNEITQAGHKPTTPESIQAGFSTGTLYSTISTLYSITMHSFSQLAISISQHLTKASMESSEIDQIEREKEKMLAKEREYLKQHLILIREKQTIFIECHPIFNRFLEEAKNIAEARVFLVQKELAKITSDDQTNGLFLNHDSDSVEERSNARERKFSLIKEAINSIDTAYQLSSTESSYRKALSDLISAQERCNVISEKLNVLEKSTDKVFLNFIRDANGKLLTVETKSSQDSKPVKQPPTKPTSIEELYEVEEIKEEKEKTTSPLLSSLDDENFHDLDFQFPLTEYELNKLGINNSQGNLSNSLDSNISFEDLDINEND